MGVNVPANVLQETGRFLGNQRGVLESDGPDECQSFCIMQQSCLNVSRLLSHVRFVTL